MSFCSNCGKQLKDGARFCSGCGSPQETVTPQPPRNSVMQHGGDKEEKVLLRVGPSGKDLNIRIITIVICAFILFFFVVIMNNSMDSLTERYRESQYEFYSMTRESYQKSYNAIKYIRNFVVFYNIILIAMSALHIPQTKKNYLVICEDKVYGEACPLFGFNTISFSLDYKTISGVDVKTFGTRLIIMTRSGKYHCFVESAGYAAMKIREKMYQ